MTYLPTHSLLTSQGWEWITNCGKDDAGEVLESFQRDNRAAQFRLGEPHSTNMSTIQLIACGMVGVYRKQEGGSLVKVVFDSPLLPSFSPVEDTPKKPSGPIQPGRYKPLEIMTCGAA